MAVTPLTQAVLLLTAHFVGAARDDPKPLSPGEWGRFAQWLAEHGVTPDRLLEEDASAVLANWTDATITSDRLQFLLGRSGALGLAVEKWERAGLWVLTRGDPDYPARLKKRLVREAPPFLVGAGNRDLLNRGGVAVVGSRDASPEDLTFATNLGQLAAEQATCVVSGGANGVDDAAMLGALHSNGRAVGVLADRLLRAATSTKYRPFIMAESLALLSPFNPEAGFDVGNAMARNKYIYCMADAAVVVATTRSKGGTWHGALETLKNDWVPLWVKRSADPASGVTALVDKGARWLPEDALELGTLADRTDATRQPDLL